jgi:hypothetical protein
MEKTQIHCQGVQHATYAGATRPRRKKAQPALGNGKDLLGMWWQPMDNL